MKVGSRRRLEFATLGFLAEMRRQFVNLHPDQECPIKRMEDYPPAERSALMAGVQKALQYGSPETDKAFETWMQRQTEKMENKNDG